MGELIHSITNLCKLLECLVSISLKPDFFRLSKSNKLSFEQIKQIWDVIHKICCFSTKDTLCDDPYKCVDSYLRKQGGVAAYFLSPDATARQLLICFGFLLSEGIIEKNIDKVLITSPLSEEIPSFMVKESGTNDDPVEMFARPDEDDPQHLLNYATFVSGKVKHNLRAVANYRQEKVQLFSKIHQATAGSSSSGFPHLSAGDLLMMVRPELQPEFLSRCQHCTPLLQAYSKWHRKRHIFWEWMVTVLEEEFKKVNKQHSVAEITHLHEFLRKLKSDVQKAQVAEDENSFEDCNISGTTRRMCLGKNGKVLDSMIEDMNLKINSLKTDNEKKIQTIKMNLFKTGNQSSAINSILESLCDTGSDKKDIRKRFHVKLPSVENLNIQSTD